MRTQRALPGESTLWLLVFLAGVSSSAHAQPREAESSGPERTLTLRVGEQSAIPARGIVNYSVGVPGIASVRVPEDGSRLIVVGRAPGTTTLLLLREDGRQVIYRIDVRGLDEDPQGIEERENVRLDLYFVSLEESYGRQIGIAWPSSYGNTATFTGTIDLTGPSVTNAQAFITEQVLPRLDLMETSGWARVLRQATVITANGSQASFLAGGEMNVPVTGSVTAELRTIRFGSDIRVTPRYDPGTGRVELQIAAEVSDLADDRGSGVPGRTLSNIETLVNLEMGQAMVLGGLVSHSRSESTDGLPGLSRIPILGLLFGSAGAREEARQTVLFIVPSVVDLATQAARERISEAFGVYWEYSGDLDELRLVPGPADLPSAMPPPEEN